MTNTMNPNETNGLLDGFAYHGGIDYSEPHTLRMVADAQGRITRVRILAEGMYCDISYIIATLGDGRQVPVQVEVANCSKFRELKKEFIAWAKNEGVYAKGLGLLDEGNWSILR